jgi:hypothetical protein
MGKFGWSLPPGCGKLPGEEPDPPCKTCGKDVDNCICPECPVCGVVGEPDCYLEEWRGGHGLTFTLEQKIGQAKLELAIREQAVEDQRMYIGYLEDQMIDEESLWESKNG